jgi:hypothetical protein
MGFLVQRLMRSVLDFGLGRRPGDNYWKCLNSECICENDVGMQCEYGSAADVSTVQ